MRKFKKIDRNIQKHFTASALIVNEKNKILLVNHKKLGVWLGPGGHLENNETPDEALIREVKEETGLDVEIISDRDEDLADITADVFVLHQPYAILCEKINGDHPHYHLDMIYRCKIINRQPQKIISHLKRKKEIVFFGLNDLSRINLFPNFRKLIEKLLRSKRDKNF